MHKRLSFLFLLAVLFTAIGANLEASVVTYDLARMGLLPGKKTDASAILKRVAEKIERERLKADTLVILFREGRYDFYEKSAATREYYISNHDQDNPKRVGIAVAGINNLVIEGNGASLVFHGRMLPIALTSCTGAVVRNLSIDFETPHIAQARVVAADSINGTVLAPEPWVKWQLTADSVFEHYGDGWRLKPVAAIAFEPDSRHIVYRTRDIPLNLGGCKVDENGNVVAPRFFNPRLKNGTVLAMRGYERPTPGVFLSECNNTVIENVTVHYAEGMGLLAQNCEDIELNRFSVRLKKNDTRYFTTQADATHFSGCSGLVYSHNGFYEGMMDDAINVHGTYLKVLDCDNDSTVTARYMHHQSWGFAWGGKGEEVRFIRSATMDTVGTPCFIESITPVNKDGVDGAWVFKIKFSNPLPSYVTETVGKESFGIENMTRTPRVMFRENVIRNNRARGALFSTPQRVEIIDNLFDHTSGSAILLCGDCNGWYETGACHDVTIRRNRFINALTSIFQFTEAVISVYPEIPDLASQQGWFHSGIVVEDNVFETFDIPLLYAKSVNGLTFGNNIVKKNNDYAPFHPNDSQIKLERVTNVQIDFLPQ